MEETCVVMVSLDDRDKAEAVGGTLVRERLAACCHLLPPGLSIYWWDGAVRREEETLMLLKTRSALFEPLRARVAELHPYDVPEIVALPISEGHGPYIEWLCRETGA